MKPFPKDKDLEPGDKMAATVLEERHLADAGRLQAMLRQLQREFGHSDLIVMAVPKGKGRPFVDGLMESIGNDPTARVVR